MLGPFGDIPYYIAGLTSLPIWKIIAVAVLVRAPSVFISAAVGAGVIDYRNPVFYRGRDCFRDRGRRCDALPETHRGLGRPGCVASFIQPRCSAAASRSRAGAGPASHGKTGLRCSLPLTTLRPPSGKAGF